MKSQNELEAKVNEITNEDLRRSIGNITQLMEKINKVIETQEDKNKQNDSQQLPKSNNKMNHFQHKTNHHKHLKNQLSTVLQESLEYIKTSRQPTEVHEQDKSEEMANICLTEDVSLFEKVNGMRKRKTQEINKTNPCQQISITIQSVKIQTKVKNKHKQSKAKSSERYKGLRQLISKKQNKQTNKKGLSIYSRRNDSALKQIQNRMSIIENIKGSDRKVELLESKKKKEGKISLRDFFNEKRIRL